MRITALVLVGIVTVSLMGCSQAATTPTPSAGSKPQATAIPTQSGGTQPVAKKKTYSTPPPMTIDVNRKYIATIETSKGKIVAELFAKDAPKTVNNFVFLSREGFYNGTTFHRVLPNFMAQGGDPTGTGSGGPGYSFEDEFSTKLRHDSAGTLSMANAGPNTNGSQFFITYVPTPFLDAYNPDGTLKKCGPGVSCHAVFGKVIQGMDVLEKIKPRDPSQNPNFLGDSIINITIEEKSP